MREWRAKRNVPIGIRELLMTRNLHAERQSPTEQKSENCSAHRDLSDVTQECRFISIQLSDVRLNQSGRVPT
jgi:hypothetical protein